MNKMCPKCEITKPHTEFGRNRSRKDGVQTYCRECVRGVQAAWYQRNSTAHRKKTAADRTAYQKAAREWMLKHLKTHPCVDCGEDNPLVLQFDHVRGTKRGNLSAMVIEGYSMTSILKEAEKCEIRCANCHSIKTAKERRYWLHEALRSGS